MNKEEKFTYLGKRKRRPKGEERFQKLKKDFHWSQQVPSRGKSLFREEKRALGGDVFESEFDSQDLPQEEQK